MELILHSPCMGDEVTTVYVYSATHYVDEPNGNMLVTLILLVSA